MPQREIRAGDRVRCLRNASDEFTRGRIYVVRSRSNNTLFIMEDDRGSLTNGWGVEQFELVEENQTTFYTLVYRTRNSAQKKIAGFEQERKFNKEKERILRAGGTVYASKKIKLSNVGE